KAPDEVAGRTEKWNRSKTLRPLAVLDPACGSGSFLIGAYQHLLDWHRDWYLEHDPAAYKDRLYQTRKDQWRLTTAERKRILLDHIYGVDIDPQAVEVTKLSLLLKVLEGESEESLNKQMRLFRERALPDLAENIKCGNSLIGPDFYQGKQLEMFSEEERLRINVFDWQAEFPAIMQTGGFDAVIGNPPYVRQEALKSLKQYLEQRYVSFASSADLFVYFMERAVKLLRDDGYFAFIVSSSFLRATYAEALRRHLATVAPPVQIVDFGGLAIFANAKDTYACIPVLRRRSAGDPVGICRVKTRPVSSLGSNVEKVEFKVPRARLLPKAWSTRSEAESAIFEKVMQIGKPLGQVVERRIFTGLKTGFNRAFVLSESERADLVQKYPESDSLVRTFVGGAEIRRYHLRTAGRYHDCGSLWMDSPASRLRQRDEA
ncbi:MAG: Eco57I restriction-modification methylase domain-containing protein, partial [Planctomycetes bacterium]|nr:Eco57I restriction-modification methylase domain-containing protein [Planctomycetota bacterium]